MSEKYKLTQTSIKREDGAHIPADMGNRDYREYLDWLASGNTPDPADPITITWDEIIAKRDMLLVGTMWTQLLDAPLGPAEVLAWMEYRQALRNIQNDFADPESVIWPEVPV